VSDFVARRVFVASSEDGMHWNNREGGQRADRTFREACGFPTNHGLISEAGHPPVPLQPAFHGHSAALVGRTRYAGILRSVDAGRTWTWSEPIEAVRGLSSGRIRKSLAAIFITLWEPMVFEQADGRLGLLIRNSTAQENPERTEKPHRMLSTAPSDDQGQHWSKARPVEVDTICSRNFAIAGVGTPDSLMMGTTTITSAC